MTDQINTILYKYSPDYAARLSFVANGDNWILISIFLEIHNSQLSLNSIDCYYEIFTYTNSI